MRGRKPQYYAPPKEPDSAYSANKEEHASTIGSGTSHRSHSPWGTDASASSTVVGSQPSASYSTRDVSLLKSPICRRCGERGHIAHDCRHKPATRTTFATSTNSTELDTPLGDAVSKAKDRSSPGPTEHLIDFASESDTEGKENNPNAADTRAPNRSRRVQQWSELDQNNIRQKVKSEEAFSEPLTEESLIDGDLDAEAARQAADATVSVQLKRKRKGRKGKNWYNLTPFVNV